MKTHYIANLAVATLFAACSSGPQEMMNPERIISKMSLEDKANYVVGTGMENASGNNAVVGATTKIIPGAAGTTYALESLGVPAIVLADGPAGLRIDPTRENDNKTYYCTHFPVGTLLASTWNLPIVEQVGMAIGQEVKEYGVDVLLAPAMNIMRNPLCGRNFEYYSEDPIVSGKTAAAYIRGVQSNGVGTSLKHFAANNQETNRMGNDARVSQRALREIYLRGFEIAVKEGKPWTVMSSYPFVNGVYASQNRELLTTILRDEWGYDGVVMTDWFGGNDGALQIAAGNDMLQPGLPTQFDSIMSGVASGKLQESDLDISVRRILELTEKTPRYKGYAFSNKPDLQQHAMLTREVAPEGMVLLKNDSQALPLPDGVKTVSLYGYSSYNFIAGGTGSGNVNHAYVVSLLDGLNKAGYRVNAELSKTYSDYVLKSEAAAKEKLENDTGRLAKYMPKMLPEELVFSDTQLRNHASVSDVAIITIGRLSGEFLDRQTSDFSLTAREKALVDNVSRIFHEQHKKVIVLLNVGGVIETASWKAQVDAILSVWQSGQEGGNSVADVLAGKVSPSGKLTMTWPVTLEDVPSNGNFPINFTYADNTFRHGKVENGVKNYDYTDYTEDIYVGYRYYDSFNREVSYPFGFGLSYTSFDYTDAKVHKNGQDYVIDVTVKNVGQADGKEIVQVYAADPSSKVRNKPVKELKTYAKTKLLKPGEQETLTMQITLRDLASFDEAQSAWTLEEGNWQLLIGASSTDIRNTLDFSVSQYEEKANNVLKPQAALNLLKR